jgi:rhamnulokinase
MTQHAYIAFDLGAGSGRAMLATLSDAERITIEELHRFPNEPVHLPSGQHWNLLALWSNLVEGLQRCGEAARARSVPILSLGVDTWGVDFGLFTKHGQLLGLPYAYRDERFAPALRRVVDVLGEQNIYQATGIQMMPFNTLYQLAAQHETEPALLELADRMLMLPDLLHYFFSGVMVNDATAASTTQLIDPRDSTTGRWATPLLERLNLPTGMLGELVPSGTPVGQLRAEIASQAGVETMQVILPGSHDTASAVAAVPADDAAGGATGGGRTWAFLSSGTWSIMGVELDQPLITDASSRLSFSNERCVGGKIRLLKNISALWLVQQCRDDLARHGQALDYAELTRLATHAEPFRTLVNPDSPAFASGGEMLAKITAFAQDTKQPAPQSPGQFVRCALESLALTYRCVFANLEQLVGHRIETLHIIGGGARNDLLNQMTADAIDRTVIVGPYEATAIGNALTQAMGVGQVTDLQHLRRIVRQSFDLQTRMPRDTDAFARQVDRFRILLDQ